MKRLLLATCLTLACAQYKGPAGEFSTLGHASVRECKEMVFPDGPNLTTDPNAPAKDSIGFDCVEIQSDHIGHEFAVMFDAALDSVANHIPGLPIVTNWVNGLGKK